MRSSSCVSIGIDLKMLYEWIVTRKRGMFESEDQMHWSWRKAGRLAKVVAHCLRLLHTFFSAVVVHPCLEVVIRFRSLGYSIVTLCCATGMLMFGRLRYTRRTARAFPSCRHSVSVYTLVKVDTLCRVEQLRLGPLSSCRSLYLSIPRFR